MSEIRRIMAYGNNSLSKLLDKIGMGSKGVIKATTTFADKMIKDMSRKETSESEGIKTGEQIKGTSLILTSIIYEGFEAYKRLDIKENMKEQLAEIDLDSEIAPEGIIPDNVLVSTINKAFSEVVKQFKADGIDARALSYLLPSMMSEEGRNYATWMLLLITSYFARAEEADAITEADKREERTSIPVPDEDYFSDEFQELNKAWFNLLRK